MMPTFKTSAQIMGLLSFYKVKKGKKLLREVGEFVERLGWVKQDHGINLMGLIVHPFMVIAL